MRNYKHTNKLLVGFTLFGFSGLALYAVLFNNLIVKSGHYIPSSDILLDYNIGLAWSVILGIAISFWKIPANHKTILLNLWLIKSIVTLGFMLAYEANYSFLDSYSYYQIPKELDFTFFGVTTSFGTDNIFRLVWLHNLFLPHSYHAVKVSFSMIGLVAVYILYKSVTILLQKDDLKKLYLIALFPSLLFWSSILGKEPVILLGVSIYIYGTIAWYKTPNNKYLIIAGIGIFIAVLIRLWFFPILAFPFCFLFLIKRQKISNKAVIFFLLLLIISLFFFQKFLNRYAIDDLTSFLNILNDFATAWNEGGSAQPFSYDFTNIDQLISFLPLGIFTALFRPLPGEVDTLFGLIAGLENFFLVFLLLFALLKTSIRKLKHPLVIWSLCLISIWSSLYAFISYQNLGSAIRFRTSILPFLLGVLFFFLLNNRRKQPSYNMQAGAFD